MSKAIRVLLADDHPILRLGLRVLLDQAPDVEVVGEAENGEEALTLIEALVPDVAVLDCQLPGLEGTRVALEIQRRGLPVRVLALSAYDDERYVRGMLEAGAAGYLLKDEAPEMIVVAVRAAA
ncbi:MAG: response regulator, partial [Anaerolineae bacterium]